MLRAIFLLLLMLIFPLIGIGVVVSSFDMLRTTRDASDWPTVRGRILSSEVVKELVYPRGQTRGTRTTKPTEMYYPKVRYEYVVDGDTYQGNRVSLRGGTSSTDRYQAELTAKKFNQSETTVYYNPANPQDALLLPGDTEGIMFGFIFGPILILVPTGLILIGLYYEFIPRPELPTHIQLWWDLKFGKHRNSAVGHESKSETSAKPQSSDVVPADSTAPQEATFIENIVTWNPTNRVEISVSPDAIWMYLLLSVVVGLILAWVGTFPVTHWLYKRDNPHLPELVSVFGCLFLIAGSIIFVVMRYCDRGSSLVLDWDSGLIHAKREFSAALQYNIRDVQRVLIRCVPVTGKHRKFRASVEMDVAGKHVTAARTREPRRKPDSAKEKAATLAEPLADALGVPVEFVGWEST